MQQHSEKVSLSMICGVLEVSAGISKSGCCKLTRMRAKSLWTFSALLLFQVASLLYFSSRLLQGLLPV